MIMNRNNPSSKASENYEQVQSGATGKMWRKPKQRGREVVQARHTKIIPNNANKTNNAQTRAVEQKPADQLPHQSNSARNKSLVVCRCEAVSQTTSDMTLLTQLVAQLDDVARAVVEALLLQAALELPVAIL
jgi:hypothetical protein